MTTEVESQPTAPARETPDDPLDRVLIEHALLSEEQLGRVRRIRSKLEEPKSVATLAVELGWVSRATLDAAIRERRKRLSVDEILVEKGSIASADLEQAKAGANVTAGESLGRKLVELGLVSEREYLETYCERFDIPFVEPDPGLVDPEILKKVSPRYLAHNRVLPLSLQDGRLNVLVDDIPDGQVLADLERIFGAKINIALGPRKQIEETIAVIIKGRGNVLKGSTGAIQYHNLQESVDPDRVSSIVDHIILQAVRIGASDIHVEPMQTKIRVRFRIDGSLVRITELPQSYANQIVSRLKVLAEADVAEHRIHQDGKIFVRMGEEEIDLRASFYVTVHGENSVLRILRKSKGLIGLDAMGMAPSTLRAFTEEALDPSTGIVLVTGPTGSGKTTTLYAAVDHVNDPSKKIITCEDPVEYVIDGITQCSIAHRPGMTFVDSLKAIVRQDPDVILIGEIRDRDSAEMAIQSALTGHKVLSTFHTEDSVGALLRLLDMGIETFLIASTVTAVLAQRLVRRLCPQCRTETNASPREIRALSLSREELQAYPLTRGKGCANCHQTGFRGRMGIHELLIMSDPLRDALIARKPSHELRRLAAERPGFLCLQEDGIAKAVRGETALSEVIENSPRSGNVRPLGRLLEAYD